MWTVAYNCKIKIKVIYWNNSFTVVCLLCSDSPTCLFPPGSDVLSWESSSWLKQRQEVSEHLCQGGLYQDSVSRRFTFEEKDVLLQMSNLQPTRWTPEQTADTIPPAACPGYYQVTILGDV